MRRRPSSRSCAIWGWRDGAGARGARGRPGRRAVAAGARAGPRPRPAGRAARRRRRPRRGRAARRARRDDRLRRGGRPAVRLRPGRLGALRQRRRRACGAERRGRRGHEPRQRGTEPRRRLARPAVRRQRDRGRRRRAREQRRRTPGAASTLTVTRVRWGGSLLEEARIHASLPLLTVAPHTVAAAAVNGAGAPAIETFAPALEPADLVVQVPSMSTRSPPASRSPRPRSWSAAAAASVPRTASGSSRSSRGCCDAAVGCSRVVTSAGWRPHTDQVGQTGTKVSPDLYIACGISGATQHIAGCKGAKKILAINSDAEAPILGNADYAVIGDLTEIVPAITAELRRTRALIDVVAGALALAAAIAVSGFLFARRAQLLVGLVRLGKPVDRSRRPAAPRPQRGRDRARPAQAAPAARARAWCTRRSSGASSSCSPRS